MAKTPEELLTEAIDAHGGPFKRAVRNAFEAITAVDILGEEYPISYFGGAQVDLLVKLRGPFHEFVFPVECKRALVSNKRWVFFEDPDKMSQLFFRFKQKELHMIHSGAVSRHFDICVEGMEITNDKLEEKSRELYKAANVDTIFKIAFQACRGGFGFVQAEIESRLSARDRIADFTVSTVIITTAPLSVVSLESQHVDILTGNHRGAVAPREVPWLIYAYPFTPESPWGGQRIMIANPRGYIKPRDRGHHLKQGIFIINSAQILPFCEKVGLTHFEGVDAFDAINLLGEQIRPC